MPSRAGKLPSSESVLMQPRCTRKSRLLFTSGAKPPSLLVSTRLDFFGVSDWLWVRGALIPGCFVPLCTTTFVRLLWVWARTSDTVMGRLRYPPTASATPKGVPYVLKVRRREDKNRFTPRLSNIVPLVSDYDFAVQHY